MRPLDMNVFFLLSSLDFNCKSYFAIIFFPKCFLSCEFFKEKKSLSTDHETFGNHELMKHPLNVSVELEQEEQSDFVEPFTRFNYE